jgi:hypothetical protein
LSERPLRHAVRLVVLGLVLGAVLYAGYLAVGVL